MYGMEYLVAPLAYGQCKRCGYSRFYNLVTDAFVCAACGGREEVRDLRRPPEPLRLVERLRDVEEAIDERLHRGNHPASEDHQVLNN